MLARDECLDRLSRQRFDALVVGGGIYGATLATALTRQKLRVALVEQKDFSHGTSANSQRIVHGGLRYLQRLDVRRMRESIASRRILLKSAPHLVEPLEVVVPAYPRFSRRPLALRAALAINDAIGWDRNNGVGADHRIPASRIILSDECSRRVPGLAGHVGGAIWYDAVAHVERLVLEYALEALRRGAVVANYVRALEYRVDHARIACVRAEDALRGNELEIRAELVIDATGPWAAPKLVGVEDHRPQKRLMLAACFVIKRSLFAGSAVGLPSPDLGRDLFFVPWQGGTLIGTLYDGLDFPTEVRGLTLSKVTRFLETVNSTYPEARLDLDEISSVQVGHLPAHMAGDGGLRLDGRPTIHCRRAGVRNLISVMGVKFTTAVAVAQKTARLATRVLGMPYVPDREEDWKIEHSAHAPSSQGSEASIGRQAAHAVREEMAHTLEDFVLRRTRLGALGHPGQMVLDTAARALARESNWSEARTADEIRRTEASFAWRDRLRLNAEEQA